MSLNRQLSGPSHAALAFVLLVAAAIPTARSSRAQGTDVRINDPAQDVGGVTQQETTFAVLEGPVSGSSDDTLCIGFRDYANNTRINGVARSLDGGSTFQDLGSLSIPAAGAPFADPTLVYSSAGGFYFGSLLGGLSGISVHRGGTDCCVLVGSDCSFPFEGYVLSESATVDKEIFAVDPASGRVYAAYYHNGPIEVVHSDDPRLEPDAAWTQASVCANAPPPPAPPPPGCALSGRGPWPAVALTGDLYVALYGYPEIKFFHRSPVGTWTEPTTIATGVIFWGDPAASAPTSAQPAGCGRTALNGFMRSEVLPQIAVQQLGSSQVIHAVWQADPDGPDPSGPDDSDVRYSRSLDGGQNWSGAVRLNDDQTTRDQWNPALGAGANGIVAVSWYDRRLDPGNWWFDRYISISDDGGVTWSKNIRLSDVSSPVARMKPHVDVASTAASCDHGDYDQVAIASDVVHVIWSDARLPEPPNPVPPPCPGTGSFYETTCPNPDIYYDRVVLNDSDADGRLDVVDNCPAIPDPTLADFDMDGSGDVCDSCPTVPDRGEDLDADGVDDACDICAKKDDFGVGLLDLGPNAPLGWSNRTTVSAQLDDDGDGVGNHCDFDYNNLGAVINAVDFEDAKANIGKLVANSNCGAAPPAGSGNDQPCGEFDHDGVGGVIVTADFNLAKWAVGGNMGGTRQDTMACGAPCIPPFSRPIESGQACAGKAICAGAACVHQDCP